MCGCSCWSTSSRVDPEELDFAACGVNKISNPGFDTFNLAPWVFNSINNGYYTIFQPGFYGPSISLFTAPNSNSVDSAAILFQTFPTVPSKTYYITFAYYAYPDNYAPASLICELSVPGSVLGINLNVNKGNWYSASMQLTANAPSSTLYCRATSIGTTRVHLDVFSATCYQ